MRCARHGIGLLLAVAMLWLLPVTTMAQEWRSERTENGLLFSARAYLPGGAGFSLTCGEKVAGGPRTIPTIYEGWVFTRPDVLRLSLSGAQIGPSTFADQRSDLVFATGDKAFRLPDLTWDELKGEWSTDIQATGPMFEAIAAARSLNIHTDQGVRRVSAQGFAGAYGVLLENCRQMFAANGIPWAAVSAAGSAPTSPDVVRRLARAEIARICNGPSTVEPEAFLTGEIDGDGRPDLVLDWRRVTCLMGDPRPLCGASRCSAGVFLSTRRYLRSEGDSFIALGVRLQPLSNGNMAIAIGGSLADCAAVGATACETLFYWNGVDLVRLP